MTDAWIPLTKTIAACGYNGPMCIGAGVLIGSKVVFSDEIASICGTMTAEFVSGAMPGERHIPECIIDRHGGRTPGVMVTGVIAYYERSQLFTANCDNLNSTR
ncbi:hypothetical protein TNCV_1226191 [Trichonephila clavipes]|nr:hypothetical protein TNCV_1226191 [Trichonephila clavipes]